MIMTIKKTVSLFIAFLVGVISVFQSTSVFAEGSDISIEGINSKIICEILEKREEKIKYFELNDGQILKVEYPVAVHKLDKHGKWSNICFNKNLVGFPCDENFVSISSGKYDISWKYTNLEKTKIQEKGNKKIYKNVNENIDLEYEAKDGKLKENLVLNSKTEKSEFEIEYYLKDLTAKKVNDKKIDLLDQEGKLVYAISSPKMFDNSGNNSENLSLDIMSFENNKLKVKMVCDRNWLQSAERVYPITIDPDYELNFGMLPRLPMPLTLATPPEKKHTSNSIFLDLTKTDFGNMGCIRVSIIGRNSSNGSEENCTSRALFFYLEAGQKYELWNNIIEKQKGYDEAQLVFNTISGGAITKLGGTAKWNPDYNPKEHNKDGKCIQLGSKSGTTGITRDKPLSVFSVSESCWVTAVRTKGNDSFVYLTLKNARGRGKIEVEVQAIPPYEKNGNFQNYTDCPNPPPSGTFTLELGKTYILTNSVRENNSSGVRLKIKGASDKDLEGAMWSPDFRCTSTSSNPNERCKFNPFVPCYKEKDVIKVSGKGNSVGSSSGRSDVPLNYIVFIQVPTISQKTDSAPYAKIMCESTSATMLLKHYGINVSLSDFIKKLPIKNVVPGVSGPDPNCAFALCAANGGYGCFSPVIANTMNKFLSGPFTAVAIEGKDLKNLVETYVKNNHPILIWATINMCPKEDGTRWKINYVDKDAKMRIGDSFVWPKHEHCVVLVGFSSDKYIVNDPNQNSAALVRCAYDKKAVEDRYNSLGKQAVVILKISIPRPVNFNPGLLNRTATVNYARKWWNGSNPEYPYFSRGDCANFASQCIHAGGIEMDDKWFCKRKSSEEIAGMGIEAATIIIAPHKQWNYSGMWSTAFDNYKYFKNSGIISEEVVLSGTEKIKEVTKGKNPVRVGDIMYLQFDRDYPHHATIISKIENGKIYYAAHTAPHFDDKSLIDFFAEYPNGRAYILKIK